MDYDEEFLDQIIDIRQRIDSGETLQELNSIREENNQEKTRVNSLLRTYFENEQYSEATKIINKLKYLITIEESLDKKEMQL